MYVLTCVTYPVVSSVPVPAAIASLTRMMVFPVPLSYSDDAKPFEPGVVYTV